MANLSEKDFLKDLAALAKDLRRDIDAYSIGLDPTPAAIAARRKRVLQGDFKFFAYTYFPHHIRGDSSFFQAHFCERFPKLLRQTGGVREWWIAPRGEAKSSLLTKIGPLWCAVQGLLERADIRKEVDWQGPPPPLIDYIVLLGAETKLPTKLLEVVKTELTVNAALSLDFPDVCGKTAVWKVGEFITKTNVKVEPFGAEQAIRGTFHGASRPKLLLGDDLITDAEAKSPTERENRWNWLEKSIDYLGPPDGSVKYLGVGTVLNKDDPLSRAKKTIGHLVHHFKAIVKFPDNSELWAQCEELMANDDRRVELQHSEKGEVANADLLPSYIFYIRHKRKMNKGAVISWPSVRSLYVLMRARAKSRTAFATEMQGDARSDEDKVFTGYQIWVQKHPLWLYYGACDPSMGKGEKSDPSALIVGGFNTDSLELNICHAERKRRTPSKLLADLIKLQRLFGCQAWGFENNNAYEYMRISYMDEAARLGVVLPLVGVTATVPQEVRIDSLEPVISSMAPRILFQADQIQLTDELDTFPEKQTDHHYDLLCALHILYSIAVSRSGGIPKITTRQRR
jgi:hypothetical protein